MIRNCYWFMFPSVSKLSTYTPLTQFSPYVSKNLLFQYFPIPPVSLIFPPLFPFFLSSNIHLFLIFWLVISYKQYSIKDRTWKVTLLHTLNLITHPQNELPFLVSYVFFQSHSVHMEAYIYIFNFIDTFKWLYIIQLR